MMTSFQIEMPGGEMVRGKISSDELVRDFVKSMKHSGKFEFDPDDPMLPIINEYRANNGNPDELVAYSGDWDGAMYIRFKNGKLTWDRYEVITC